MNTLVNSSRRRFLVFAGASGGALLVGCNRLPPEERVGDPRALALAPAQESLNAWVRIGRDGSVTIPVPRAEMGQGVTTALPMLVAEELEVPWDLVRFAQAPLDPVYRNATVVMEVMPFESADDGFIAENSRAAVSRLARTLGIQITGGSTSVRDAWDVMRLAGASARLLLVEAASRQWNVPVYECRAEQGRVRHQSGKSAGYGELVGLAATLPVPATPHLKQPRDWKLIGTSTPKLDTIPKVDGSAQFAIDVRLPGQLYAAITICPVPGGTLASHDAAAATATKGVIKVIALADAVAVVAEQYWIAQQALDGVKVTWNEGVNAALDSTAMAQRYDMALKDGNASVYRKEGNVVNAFADASPVEAHYRVPYLAHATMEPMNCTALLKDGRLEIWCGNQSATLVRYTAARAADIDQDSVTVHSPYVGGGFGRRVEMDVVVRAVVIAQQVEGRPVQVIWTRETDMQQDRYRPAVFAHMRAAIAPGRRLVAWTHRMVGPSVNYSFMQRHLSWAATNAMNDKTNAEGAVDLPYAIPNLLVEHVLEQGVVPVGNWRSVGHSYNAFFTECFIDEISFALGKDPVELRRELLSAHPRHRAVLDLVAAKAGWGTQAPTGIARGIGLHQSYGSIVAQVAEVSVDESLHIRVHRVVCAIDCGPVVHPDIVVAQMESSIVFGLSAALMGEITFRNGKAEQSNFHDYPVLRMLECPRIEVHIARSNAAIGGVGEPGTPPIAPAVANAVFAATGKRVRTLPLRLKH